MTSTTLWADVPAEQRVSRPYLEAHSSFIGLWLDDLRRIERPNPTTDCEIALPAASGPVRDGHWLSGLLRPCGGRVIPGTSRCWQHASEDDLARRAIAKAGLREQRIRAAMARRYRAWALREPTIATADELLAEVVETLGRLVVLIRVQQERRIER